jgi:hypothetical protein
LKSCARLGKCSRNRQLTNKFRRYQLLIKGLHPSIAATITLFVIISLLASPVFGDQTSAQTAIMSAQNNLMECYNVTKQAEAAGANVDSLLDTLNIAAGLLSEAQFAYTRNDYSLANKYATQSQSQLSGFISQATSLEENALNSQNETFMTFVLSIIFTAAILSAGIVGWAVLSRKQRKNLA